MDNTGLNNSGFGQRRKPARSSRRGFSLLELTVAIGVVLVLLSIALPAIRSVRAQAAMTADLSLLRQNAILASAYCGDYKGVYPIAADTGWRCAAYWGQAVVEAGGVKAITEIDPTYDLAEGRQPTRHSMTVAAAFDWTFMVLGQTRDPVVTSPSPVRQENMLYPDAKGLLWTSDVLPHFVPAGSESRSASWCCVEGGRPGGVAMCDTSARQGRWPEFVSHPDRGSENGIGLPVFTTWDGCRGRDGPL